MNGLLVSALEKSTEVGRALVWGVMWVVIQKVTSGDLKRENVGDMIKEILVEATRKYAEDG